MSIGTSHALCDGMGRSGFRLRIMTHEELIEHFAGGTTHVPLTSVIMESEKFVVFCIKGHHYWSGLGQPWAYAPVRHVLIAKSKGTAWSNPPRREWEGRITKSRLAEIKEILERSEEAGFVLGPTRGK